MIIVSILIFLCDYRNYLNLLIWLCAGVPKPPWGLSLVRQADATRQRRGGAETRTGTCVIFSNNHSNYLNILDHAKELSGSSYMTLEGAIWIFLYDCRRNYLNLLIWLIWLRRNYLNLPIWLYAGVPEPSGGLPLVRQADAARQRRGGAETRINTFSIFLSNHSNYFNISSNYSNYLHLLSEY